jgi:hypothetical protein
MNGTPEDHLLNPIDMPPQPDTNRKRISKFILGTILGITIPLLVAGVGFFYAGTQKNNQSQRTKIPTQTTPQPTSKTTIDGLINTLDYFLSDHPDVGLTGSHPLSQTRDGNAVYYVKWGDTSYERHVWDENYIYLQEDHSEAPVQPYTFTPGIWMKRHMRVGESLSFLTGENTIQFFTDSCEPVSTNSGPYKYIMTLEQHIPDFNAGGDLGVQDVIVLIYDYRPAGAANYEKFYYSKEWGWIRWENIDAAGNIVQVSEFNRKHKVISPDRTVSCL